MKYIIILFLLSNGVVVGQPERTNGNLERVIHDDVLIEMGSFYPSDEGLFRPELFVFDSDHKKLFIYDYGIKNLVSVEFKNLSTFETLNVTEIGNGIGSGPGEFRNPTDICLSKKEGDSKLIIIDPDLARVSIWNASDNSFLRSFRPKKFVPFRLTCSSEKIILFNSGYHPKGSLVVYDYEGNLISHIKEPNRNKKNVSILENGYLTMDESYTFFSGTDSEVLKKYSHSEKVFLDRISFINAEQNEKKVKVKKTEREITYQKGDDFSYGSRGIGQADNSIFVFYSGRKDAYGNTIDFYSKEDLGYRFSAKIDGLANTMKANDKYIMLKTYDFERKENYLTFYKFDNR